MSGDFIIAMMMTGCLLGMAGCIIAMIVQETHRAYKQWKLKSKYGKID